MINIIFNIENTFHLFLGKSRSARVRRKSLSDIRFWSMHDCRTQSLMRTNNLAEAYHRRINSIFQCAHPTLWLFPPKTHRRRKRHPCGCRPNQSWRSREKEKAQRTAREASYEPSQISHVDLSSQIDSIAHNIRL